MSSRVDTPDELAGGAFERTLRGQAADLKRELIRQTLEDLESWAKALRIEYAQAHPDRPHDLVYIDGSGWVSRSDGTTRYDAIIPEAELEGYRNAIRNEYYEWVIPTFEGYLEPDPDLINPMVEALRSVESMFGGSQDDADNYETSRLALTRINDVRTAMGYWEGDLQVNFLDNFVTPLQNTPVNQAAAVKMAREVLELNKLAYIAQRKAILDLLKKSIDALKELSKNKSPDAHQWATLVGIAVGTILTGFGVTAWVGIALISASTIAQGLAPDPTKEIVNITAPTAQEIAVNIVKALGILNTSVREDEDAVKELFQTLKEGIVYSRGKMGELSVPKPNLSGAPADVVTGGGLRPRD